MPSYALRMQQRRERHTLLCTGFNSPRALCVGCRLADRLSTCHGCGAKAPLDSAVASALPRGLLFRVRSGDLTRPITRFESPVNTPLASQLHASVAAPLAMPAKTPGVCFVDTQLAGRLIGHHDMGDDVPAASRRRRLNAESQALPLLTPIVMRLTKRLQMRLDVRLAMCHSMPLTTGFERRIEPTLKIPQQTALPTLRIWRDDRRDVSSHSTVIRSRQSTRITIGVLRHRASCVWTRLETSPETGLGQGLDSGSAQGDPTGLTTGHITSRALRFMTPMTSVLVNGV